MVKRTLAGKLRSLARHFPVISITGPRQSGKTTLSRLVFKNHEYVSLEDPDQRDFALSDPKGFLRRFREGVILDEIQRAPVLLSYLQGIVDREDVPGRFILTGSQQLRLANGVSQTLAGRTAIVILLPFSLFELVGRASPNPWIISSLPKRVARPAFSLEKILFQGFYPRIHDKGLDAHDWLGAYYATYIERDVRSISNIGNLEPFQRFVRLCAARSGQMLNLSSLASDCGISHPTARQWISVLQAGFIIHLLPPHFANFSKRLVKSPKLYFLDTGLLCYLLRIREPDEIMTHALKGPIFETFVLAELYKAFVHQGDAPPLYYWRDRTGHEVDFLLDAGKSLIPIEAKSGETVSQSSLDGLRYFRALGPPASKKGALVYGGDTGYEREGFAVRPWYLPA